MGIFKRSGAVASSDGPIASSDGPIAQLGLTRDTEHRLQRFRRRAEHGDTRGEDLAFVFMEEQPFYSDGGDQVFLMSVAASYYFPLDLSINNTLDTGLVDLTITPEDDFEHPRAVARNCHGALLAIVQSRLGEAGDAPGTLDYGAIIEEAVSIVSPDGYNGPNDHLPAVFARRTSKSESLRRRWLLRMACHLAGNAHVLAPVPEPLVQQLKSAVAGRVGDATALGLEARVLLGASDLSWNDLSSGNYWERG